MSDQLTANFSGKGFTKNFLELMAMREQFKKCCKSWLTQITTENSSTIIFSGLGTIASPLTANVVLSPNSGNILAIESNGLFAEIEISPDSGNILVLRSDGLFSSGSTYTPTANDGLSVASGVIKLGQTYNELGAPATLTEYRQIPLNGFNFLFTDDQVNSQGNLQAPAILLNGWTVSNDNATAALFSTYGASGIAIVGTYGEDLQLYSFVTAQAGFFGYIGSQSSSYITAQGNGSTHGKFINGYIAGYTSTQVWDGTAGGAFNVGNLIGMVSILNSQNGTATNGFDFYASELNTGGLTTNSPHVTNHYALYAEQFSLATNNHGVYINGTQPNYFGGNVGIGVTIPIAWLDIATGTTSKPPILLATGGTLVTTPLNGAIEWDSTNLYVTASGTRKTILSETAVSSSVTNTITNKVAVNIGGTTYYLLASTSAT